MIACVIFGQSLINSFKWPGCFEHVNDTSLMSTSNQVSCGARGVMVIVTGYGHGDTSSIPGEDWLHFI